MITWGTSFGSHDAALAVFENNQLLFASHSERFSKKKDDPNLCEQLIDYVVRRYGSPNKIFYYENPWLKKLRYIRSGQFSNLVEPLPKSTLKSFGINADVTYTEHHLSHAAAGFYTSGFEDATVLVIDAIGEIATTTIWQADSNGLKKKYQQNYPHSMGLFYSAMTDLVGLKPNGEEYIFMGMAAYGNPAALVADIESKFIRYNNSQPLIRLTENLHIGAADLADINWDNNDVAAGTQEIYERCLKHILLWAYNNLPSKNIILMGGCALNCVANSKIKLWNNWHNVWIMPNPGDAGSAIGCVLASTKQHINWPGPYLGLKIGNNYPIKGLLEIIEQGLPVGVANGAAEFGPRALGNRSLLADPRVPDIKNKMNNIKKRELFRPFAAVILEELANDYFVMDTIGSSPYMQYTVKCRQPNEYKGVVHVDGTSRIQTVNQHQHPSLHKLLTQWYEISKCPMLINTSLNIKNQPLINDMADVTNFEKLYGINVLV